MSDLYPTWHIFICAPDACRYVPGLRAQLRATLLHLMGLAQAGDGVRARDGLSRRADTMLATICGAASEAAAALAAAAATAVASRGDGSTGDNEATSGTRDLPHDPFGGESSTSGGLGSSRRKTEASWGLLDAAQEAAASEGLHQLSVSRSRKGYPKWGALTEGTGADEQRTATMGLVRHQVACIGAAAAGFGRMCEAAQSNVREQHRKEAEALEAEARAAAATLLAKLA